MEKLRKMIHPESFSILKVSKHSSEVIRFDAELENRTKLERVLARLEDRIIQLNDYPDPLKVKVSECKSDFPSRHSWDSFFRDATDMDEMKPGERPDTIHIRNLPIRWFIHERDRDEDTMPSESLFKKVFDKYGPIRQVDVPAADPFRMQMKAPMRGITTPPQDFALYFEGYIQFSEYAGFVRCMDALRGRKLLRRGDDIAEWCPIYVDFDKTKHMTDASVKRRSIVRERLTARQRAKDEEEKQEKEKIAKREARERQKETVKRIIFQSLSQKMEHREQEKMAKMREREQKRKKKQLAKLMERDDVDLNRKVAEEQGKLLKTQKRLQAIRLIEELFKRIEVRPELQRNGVKTERYYKTGDRLARQRIVDKYKRQQEKALDEQQERLRHALDGRIIIRSALETKKPHRESISSMSEDEQIHKRVKSERPTSPERDGYKPPGAGMFGYNPYGFNYAFPAPPPSYPFPQTSMYYPVRGAYYPPPDAYARRPFRGRGRGRGRGRLPYFEGPDATQQYYQYFKKLSEAEQRNEHDHRSRSRSRSRSRRRSYSRSRSRSRRRSYSRSRSRSRRSRSRSRRSRSRSRRSRSHSHNSRSRRRSRSRSRRSKSKSKSRSKSKSKRHTPSPREAQRTSVDSAKFVSPGTMRRQRSKSWSLPKDGERRKSWSKSPEKKNE
ncbi:A-kinase anchor protein 17A isoform X3 [Bicyclus anynana]|nr:A-kinase anchor protein 17A isoform X3 [Bicyclus anynana]